MYSNKCTKTKTEIYCKIEIYFPFNFNFAFFGFYVIFFLVYYDMFYIKNKNYVSALVDKFTPISKSIVIIVKTIYFQDFCYILNFWFGLVGF